MDNRDNRWNERQPIHIDVMIYYGPLGLLRAKATDISNNGMFVESGRIVLSSDEVIQVSFEYPGLGDNNNFSIPAHVVHSSSKGAGLQFHNYVFTPPEQQDKKNYYMVGRYR